MRAISTFPWEIRDTGLSFENPGSQATFLRGQKQNCGGRRNCEEPLAGSFRTATEEDSSGPTLLQKRDALHAGNLKAFAATHVLAHHHVVAPQHVRLRFGELGTVPLVGPRRQRLLLGAHQPLDLILGRLMAVRTTQVGRLLVRFFIKKFALIHKCWALGLINAATAPLIHVLCEWVGHANLRLLHFLRMECAKMRDYDHASQAQEESILRRQGGPRNGPRTRGDPQTLPPGSREEDQTGEAQAHSG